MLTKYKPIKRVKRGQVKRLSFLQVWGRKGSLWYNEKNIIGFGVGFLKW
jgi:hypothetical protein